MARILGIDYGTRRLGFALSDPDKIIATPLCVVQVHSTKEAARQVKQLCEEQDIERIVIGMPFNMNGTSGPAAKAVTAFAELLREQTGIPVETWDERLSTSMVERALLESDISRSKRKKVRDKLAAQVILQSYLDAPHE